MRHRMILVFLCAALTLGASDGALAGFNITNGQHNQHWLQDHYFQCHDSDCSEIAQPQYGGCLVAKSASNQFIAGIGMNCGAVYNPPSSTWFEFVANRRNSDWIEFAIYGSGRDPVLADIEHCLQEVSQTHCTSGGEPLYGAYRVNDDLVMDDMPLYVDFAQTGPPFLPGSYDWSDVLYYVGLAVDADYIVGPGAWRIVSFGLLQMVVDALSNNIPALMVVADPGRLIEVLEGLTERDLPPELYNAAKRSSLIELSPPSALDLEWALLNFHHAVLGWQSWHMESGDPDILGAIGISPIAFSEEATPTFMYEMEVGLQPEISVPVKTRETSWGMLKARFDE